MSASEQDCRWSILDAYLAWCGQVQIWHLVAYAAALGVDF